MSDDANTILFIMLAACVAVPIISILSVLAAVAIIRMGEIATKIINKYYHG